MEKCKLLIQESIQVKTEIISSGILESINVMGIQSALSIKKQRKIMLCGNGGSAADAQH